MKKIYLYPNILIGNTRSKNPYMNNLTESLSIHNQVINRGNPSRNGIFDIFKYMKLMDVLYLNWVEDLPERRGGTLQSFFFILLIGLLKLSGKKVIWTLHNKKSHSVDHRFIKSVLFRLLLRRSDLIITHASEGLKSIPENTPKLFIHHPVDTNKQNHKSIHDKIYDIIIWGTITKYKGIDKFLKHLVQNGLAHKYRIIIAGTVKSVELIEELEQIDQDYPNIGLLNRFIEEEELVELIEKSKLILFCYQSDSILSSGALMDSLLFDSTIIGPNVGAFADLSQEELIYSFKNFDDLIKLMDPLLADNHSKTASETKKQEFIKANSWETFSDRISKELSQL